MSKKGIKFWENPDTYGKGIMEKKFYIEYPDNMYFHRTIFLEFININVKNHGKMWMYVVKSDDYKKNRLVYGEIVKVIHDMFVSVLQMEYDYDLNQEVILIDWNQNVYGNTHST